MIFAPDAETAVAEMLRVIMPGGRLLVSAWLPQGPVHEFLEIIGQAMAAHRPARVGRRFAWGVPETTRELLERHGAAVEIEFGQLVFTASSPEAWMLEGETSHPLGVVSAQILSRAGTYEEVRDRALAALAAGNEDPTALRVTSRYLVARAQAH